MGFRSPLGRLGRQVGLRRALWAEKGGLENYMEGSWDRLWALLAYLGPVLGRFAPPGGARGAVPEGIFEGFFGTSRLRSKNCAFSNT